jgi:hypothetical protein
MWHVFVLDEFNPITFYSKHLQTFSKLFYMCTRLIIKSEIFEDTREIIRSRNSKDRQSREQKPQHYQKNSDWSPRTI